MGDGFARNSPAWIETVKSLHPDFPVYGSICEGHEKLWRIIGSENVMLWIGLYPDELGRFIERLGRFVIELTRAQIKAAGGLLDGMVIWGDVAYVNGMLFSPDYWRRALQAHRAEQIRVCHEAGLPVIYHGCGNASAIFDDFIEMGLDAYNPLEAKAGLDVVELAAKYGHRMGFCGNMDVLAWANAPDGRAAHARAQQAERGQRRRLHLPVRPFRSQQRLGRERYHYVVELVRAHGTYPLVPGEFDVPAGGAPPMTSRERVLTAFDHREPDRVPAWCGSSPEFWAKAKKALGLDDEGLRRRFGDDFRSVYARYAGRTSAFPGAPRGRARSAWRGPASAMASRCRIPLPRQNASATWRPIPGPTPRGWTCRASRRKRTAGPVSSPSLAETGPRSGMT